jgi:Rab3 GTPase-activating protein catalytic subunit
MNSTSRQQYIADNNPASLPNIPPKSMADLLNKSNDFQAYQSNNNDTPSIAYWYGLCKYLTISPTRTTIDTITSESKANLLLSSAAIAINNTGCTIPIFVRVHSIKRNMFIGLCEGSALKTHFQVVHFNYIPYQYEYLNGLIDIFKSKLGSHIPSSSLLISVSVRFTYSILENKTTFLDWQQFSELHHQATLLNEQSNKSDDNDNDNVSDNDDDPLVTKEDDQYPDLKKLPFGAVQDCVESLYLSCVWSNLSEDIIIDSDSFSDLNAQRSNDWSLTVNTICDKCDLQLTNLLIRFCEEAKRTISINQVLTSLGATFINDERDKNALTKTISNSNFYNLLDSANNNIKLKLPDDLATLPLDKQFTTFIIKVNNNLGILIDN